MPRRLRAFVRAHARGAADLPGLLRAQPEGGRVTRDGVFLPDLPPAPPIDADTWPPLISPIDATPRARNKRPEEVLHRSVWKALGLLLDPSVVVWSVENARNGRREGARRVARGCVQGVPDLAVHWPDAMVTYIELKAGRNTTTPEQRRMHERLQDIGVGVGVCRSLDEVVAFLKGLGVPMRRMS